MCGACAVRFGGRAAGKQRCIMQGAMVHSAWPTAMSALRHVAKCALHAWRDVARCARSARNVGTTRRTMRASRAMRAYAAGPAVRMLALASRGQPVPTAREGLFSTDA